MNAWLRWTALVVLAWAGTAWSAEDIITTIAGGYPRENSPAAALTTLNAPEGLFVEAAGTVLYSDTLNHRVRRYNPATGTLTTLAGSGFAGDFGDGGPAVIAWLNSPSGVWVDAAGNIYIGDAGNNRVRKITAATGLISTIAGNGIAGFTGDGGPATSARLDSPTGVATDSLGNVLIADRNNNRIRRVDTAGVISNYAGSGGALGDGGPATAAQLVNPRALFVDASNNCFIADTNQHRIRLVDAASGNISTVAGNGVAGFSGDGAAATAAQLNSPRGVWVNAASEIFIGDRTNRRIRKVSGGIITTVAGTGVAGFAGDGGLATAADLNNPNGVGVDSAGQIFIADRDNNAIRRVDAAGIINTVVGTPPPPPPTAVGDGLHALFAALINPSGIALDGAGNLLIADSATHRVRRVDALTHVISTIAGTGFAGFAGDGGPATAAQLDTPTSVTVDATGKIYIADSNNARIRAIDTLGNMATFAGTGAPGFSGDTGPATAAQLNNPLCVFAHGTGIYIADTNNDRIRKVDAGSVIATVAGGGAGAPALGDGATAIGAGLNRPRGVCLDGGSVMYIADTNNQRVRKVDAAGNISTLAGNGNAGYSGDGDLAAGASLSGPRGVGVDTAGNVFVADTNNSRVRKVYVGTGKITTVAGGGPAVFQFGDGGPATEGNLAAPNQALVDAAGNILIADSGHGLVRKVGAGSNRAPEFMSLANATPNPALIGQVVVFDTQAIDPDGDVVAYNWIFGDGTFGYESFATHIYTAAGLYFAKVVASDGDATTDSSGMTIVVNAAATTDAANFLVTGASIKFNFKDPLGLKDSVSVKGQVPVPAGFLPDTLPAVVRVGNLARAFTLNAKGAGVNATDPKNNTFKLSGKAPLLKFSFGVKKQTLFAELVDLGFVNTTVLKPGLTLTIPVAVSINNVGYLTTITMVYNAKAGASGSAKFVKPKKP